MKRRNALKLIATAPFAYLSIPVNLIPDKLMAENITASRRLKIDKEQGMYEELVKKEYLEREQEYALENMPEGSFAKYNTIKKDGLDGIVLYVMLKKKDGKDLELIYRSTKLDKTITFFETFVGFDGWMTHKAMGHTGMNILTYHDYLLSNLAGKNKVDDNFYSVFYNAEGRSATFSASLINEDELKKIDAAKGIGIVTVDDSLKPMRICEADKPLEIGYIRICTDLSNITQAVDLYSDIFCKKLLCKAKKIS